MFFYLVLILIILFLLFMLSMIWPPDSPWAPWWRTSKKTARAICNLADIKEDDFIYDLGSGDGTALMVASKEYGARGIGIEIDPFRALLSLILLNLNGSGNKVEIKRGNFFDYNLRKADVVFVYLIPKTLDKLIPKFKKELNKGTRIVSFKYEMKLPLKKEDKKNEIRLYVI